MNAERAKVAEDAETTGVKLLFYRVISGLQ